MGTTMHAHIEVKKDDRWLHYGCPDVERDYMVFACINGTRKDAFEDSADVYNRIHPVSTVHELPTDISEVTQICLEMDKSSYKLHGFGVLSGEDLEKLQRLLYEMFGNEKGTFNDLEAGIFKTYIGGNSIARHEGFDDVRVVYWFDN